MDKKYIEYDVVTYSNTTDDEFICYSGTDFEMAKEYYKREFRHDRSQAIELRAYMDRLDNGEVDYTSYTPIDERDIFDDFEYDLYFGDDEELDYE